MSKQLPVPAELLPLIEKREQPDRRTGDEPRPADQPPPAVQESPENDEPSPPQQPPSDADRRKTIRRAEDRQQPRNS